MTSLVRSIGIAGGILMLAGVQNASAQIVNPVEFTTSFPFTVGNTNVPAGSYTIRQDDDNPAILELTGGHTSAVPEDNTQARETPAKTEVVFKRYGDGYVLKDIWLAGSNDGAETIALEGERHAAKHGGANDEQRVTARKKLDTSKKR